MIKGILNRINVSSGCRWEETYLDNVELVDRLKLGRGISSGPRCTEIVSKSILQPPASMSLKYSGV